MTMGDYIKATRPAGSPAPIEAATAPVVVEDGLVSSDAPVPADV